MVVEVGDVAVSAAHVPMAQAVELRTELGTIPTTASDPSNSATDTGDVAAPPAQVPMAQAVELGAVQSTAADSTSSAINPMYAGYGMTVFWYCLWPQKNLWSFICAMAC